MPESDEIIPEDKILIALFGEPYRTHKNINGVDIYLRTLFDAEVFDAIKRANKEPEINERDWAEGRWKLAYSLIAVNGKDLPSDLDEKYRLINSWLNVYVSFLITYYNEAVSEEIDLVSELKKNLSE